LAIVFLASAIGSFTTATPDVIVMSLTSIAAWHMLANDERATKGLSFVPVVLTCGVLMSKLSGILLVPVAALFAVLGKPIRYWVAAACTSALLAGPYFIASFLTTGCLAFLVSLSCLPVDWRLSTEFVDRFSHLITVGSRWEVEPIPPDLGPWEWLPGWLAGTRYWLNAAVFWPSILALVGYLGIAKWRFARGELWIMTLILPSMILILTRAPELRYNFGVFIAPMALLAARLAGPTASPCRVAKGFQALEPIPMASILGIAVVAFAITSDIRHSLPVGLPERVLLPRHAPTVEVNDVAGNGFNYVVPESGGACWGAKLPCSDHALSDVTLRAPDRGIAGGFKYLP